MGKTKSDMNWLTPRANETNESPDKFVKRNNDRGAHCHGTLTSQVNWPTPASTETDAVGPRPSRIKTNRKTEYLSRTVNTESKKLNPDWVEQLMGLPVGWTQLSGVTDPNENRIDRLRLLGNGVVNQTAEKAFRTLLEGLCN